MKLALTLIGLFWIGIVGAADVTVLRGAWEAFQSGSWAPTDGVVTQCELKAGPKKSVRLVLAYTYTVDGRQYTGHEYQPGPHLLPNQKWQAVQAALPVGTAVTVYHNPLDPADAVLNPGLKPDILSILLTIAPFNVVGIGLAWAWRRAITNRRGFDPAHDVRLAPAGYRARLNGFGPAAVFLLSLLAFSFAGTFLVVVLTHLILEVPTSWALDGAAWVVILAACAWIASRFRTPREVVEGVDAITLPASPTGRATIEVPRDTIRGFDICSETRSGRKKPQTVYIVVLRHENGSAGYGSIRFAEYTDRADAEVLVHWLGERLNI